RNSALEPQHDFRFTIEPKRKAWDLNPHGGEAARFSKPARRAVSGYLPYSVDRPGNRTPIPWLQARHLPVGRAAHVFCQRSVWELNPVFRDAKAACGLITYRPI